MAEALLNLDLEQAQVASDAAVDGGAICADELPPLLDEEANLLGGTPPNAPRNSPSIWLGWAGRQIGTWCVA